MNCPKCQGSMRSVDFEDVSVDRCTRCGGIWFDLLEQQDLKQKPGSERIDAGDPAEGRKRDDQVVVMCPIDNVRMIGMVDAAQPHIWFESCPVCHGAFFDAGEFTDFKERSLAELLRRRRRKRSL
jgi:Zn-finger nucleic acid-binding protein